MTKKTESINPDKCRGDYFYLFIINPRAGRKYMKTLAEQIEKSFVSAGRKDCYSIVITDRGGHAIELAGAFADMYGDRGIVVACGGDGTVGEVAQALYLKDSALAVLPVGTANDFVKTVYPGLTLDQILKRLQTPRIEKIDTFFVDDILCANIMSLGFDTKVQKTASRLLKRYRWLGRFSYPFAIIMSLFGNRQYNMKYSFETIEADGSSGHISGELNYILAAVCNGRYYGGGFNPAPRADLQDGMLDLCIVDSINLLGILSLIGRYKKGKHLGHPAIHYHRVSSGYIETTDSHLLLGNIDGEQFEKTGLSCEIRPSSLNFVFL